MGAAAIRRSAQRPRRPRGRSMVLTSRLGMHRRRLWRQRKRLFRGLVRHRGRDDVRRSRWRALHIGRRNRRSGGSSCIRMRHTRRTGSHRLGRHGLGHGRLRWPSSSRNGNVGGVVENLVERVLHEIDHDRDRVARLRHVVQLVVGEGDEAKATLSASFLCVGQRQFRRHVPVSVSDPS